MRRLSLHNTFLSLFACIQIQLKSFAKDLVYRALERGPRYRPATRACGDHIARMYFPASNSNESVGSSATNGLSTTDHGSETGPTLNHRRGYTQHACPESILERLRLPQMPTLVLGRYANLKILRSLVLRYFQSQPWNITRALQRPSVISSSSKSSAS